MKKKLFWLLFLPLLAACGDDDDAPSIAEVQNINKNTSTAFGADRLEMPRLKGTDNDVFIVNCLDDGDVNYSMEYCCNALHSRWVAYRYDRKSAMKNAPTRTDAWAPDPNLKNYKYAQVAVQIFNGYQRGHILGSAERYYSKQANEQTFYMSNMSPMIGAFNTTYWGTIEDKVRDDWGRPIASGDTLYVVKGGTIENDQLNTRLKVLNTNGSETYMAVPKYYFIALLMRKASGSLSSIGFMIEHKDFNNKSPKFLEQLPRDCAMSIDELEKKTGLDFFCNLPDNVENTVESSYSLSQWPGL